MQPLPFLIALQSKKVWLILSAILATYCPLQYWLFAVFHNPAVLSCSAIPIFACGWFLNPFFAFIAAALLAPYCVIIFIHIIGTAPLQTHIVGNSPILLFGFIGFLMGQIRQLSLQGQRELKQRIVAEKEKNKLEKQWQYSEKMQAVGELSGGIAHDFNNIIGAILGYAQLTLIGETLSDTAKTNIENIIKACQCASKTVNGILSFCSEDSREKTPIAIGPHIAESLDLIRSLFPSSISIDCALHEEKTPVLANASHIHKILINLCVNAAQAMNDRGTIWVTLTEAVLTIDKITEFSKIRPGTYSKITVKDHGCGIEESIRSKIFEPFFTTKPPGKGPGLGLAVVYGIVNELAGAINVQTAKGKGTSFEIYLPHYKNDGCHAPGIGSKDN